jgi:hypothetical protein
MTGQHRMRRRQTATDVPSRYWDCINNGCGQFLYDMMPKARKRIVPSVAAICLGPCKGAWKRTRP